MTRNIVRVQVSFDGSDNYLERELNMPIPVTQLQGSSTLHIDVRRFTREFREKVASSLREMADELEGVGES